MKLLDILRETNEDINSIIANLNDEQRKILFQRGSLLVPKPQDPSRPGTISSKVIRLPKAEEIKRKLIIDKKEFESYQYHPDNDIKEIAKEINRLYNQLYNTIKALDNILKLKKSGEI